MIRLTFLLLISFFITNFSWSQTPDHILENYEISWQDEFDGTELDKTKWAYRATGSKRRLGIVSEENVFLDGDGHLVIQATKVDTNYYVGMISTYKIFYQKYGYFECKASMTSQYGCSSAFWLQSPTYGETVGDPARSGTEIDICEYRHHDGKEYVHHTNHWDGYGSDHKQESSHTRVKGFYNSFHTFGLEWTEDKYTFYIDGKKTWSTKKAISQTGQYIILSLEMNMWSGDPVNSVFPDEVVFDWVRVWKEG